VGGEPEALRLLVHRHRAVLPVRHRRRRRCTGAPLRAARARSQARHRRVPARYQTGVGEMRIFRAPEFLGTAFMLAVLALLIHALLET
jgi:hypothetical protein